MSAQDPTPEDAPDRVTALGASWELERPDLDFAEMVLAARIHRASFRFLKRAEAAIRTGGLTTAAFDVLSALRRSGTPYMLTPSALTQAVMLSPGGMTHRLDQLALAGHVTRTVDSRDKRGRNITLTEAGLAALDDALAHHLEALGDGLAVLTQEERETLAELLQKLYSGGQRR
jgi:DNA-binding MarR family transcriptional regulator